MKQFKLQEERLRMEKKQVEIKNLKPGGYVLIDDVPCKVDSVQKSKPGKHGGAKARIVATGLFETKKVTIVKPADTKIDVPVVEKKAMQLISISADMAQLMDLEDYSLIDVPIPEELKSELSEGIDVLVWKWGKFIMLKGKK